MVFNRQVRALLLKSRFEHISPADYDLAAVLAREVADAMLSRLDWVALKPKRIIEIGCGTGYCTQLLQKRYPAAELLAIDDSPAMLAYAKTSGLPQANWLCASLDKLPVEDHTIDLIVSNLTLPWCMDLMKLFHGWQRVLRPEGLLMFSSFGPHTLRELKGQAVQLPHFVDMHNVGDALIQVGFVDPVLEMDYFTLTYREQQQLQEELQLTGFLTGQNVLGPLEKNVAGVISLTYEIVYGHAWQAAMNKNVMTEGGVVKFPLAHLRGRRTI